MLVLYTDVPGKPGKPTASDIDATQMTVSWTAPESDGGSPILGYYLERKETPGKRWTRFNKQLVKETNLVVTGLVEKTKYQFRVFAENNAGPGPASEPSDIYEAKPPYGKYRNLRNLFML